LRKWYFSFPIFLSDNKTSNYIQLDEVYYDLPFYAGIQVLRAFPDSEFSAGSRKKRSGSVAVEAEMLSANNTIEVKMIDDHVSSNLTSLEDLGIEASESTGYKCSILLFNLF
jgi:hypothetical protein